MIASLYAGLLALLFLALSIHVVRGRFRYRTALGDGGHMELTRRIRAQANFLEYTPFFIILLTLAEHNGLAPYGVHLFGALFLASRISHAYSLLHHERYEEGRILAYPVWRTAGMLGSFGCIAGLALTCLLHYAT